MEKIDENDNKIESKTETNMDSNNKEESQCDKDQNEDINSTLKQMGDLLYNNKNLKRGEQAKDKYKFWDTQPVPSFKDEVNTTTIGPIDESEDLELIRKIPLNLPKNYSWHDINIKDKKELKMVNFYYFLI
jgi:glycylpeptide N-tetradecanoyltransferase